jgi:ubiquinone/menaquinone biosynthesis C-methylase UbiE
MDDDPTIVTMDAAAMTFPDGSFDYVTLSTSSWLA